MKGVRSDRASSDTDETSGDGPRDLPVFRRNTI